MGNGTPEVPRKKGADSKRRRNRGERETNYKAFTKEMEKGALLYVAHEIGVVDLSKRTKLRVNIPGGGEARNVESSDITFKLLKAATRAGHQASKKETVYQFSVKPEEGAKKKQTAKMAFRFNSTNYRKKDKSESIVEFVTQVLGEEFNKKGEPTLDPVFLSQVLSSPTVRGILVSRISWKDVVRVKSKENVRDQALSGQEVGTFTVRKAKLAEQVRSVADDIYALAYPQLMTKKAMSGIMGDGVEAGEKAFQELQDFASKQQSEGKEGQARLSKDKVAITKEIIAKYNEITGQNISSDPAEFKNSIRTIKKYLKDRNFPDGKEEEVGQLVDLVKDYDRLSRKMRKWAEGHVYELKPLETLKQNALDRVLVEHARLEISKGSERLSPEEVNRQAREMVGRLKPREKKAKLKEIGELLGKVDQSDGLGELRKYHEQYQQLSHRIQDIAGRRGEERSKRMQHLADRELKPAHDAMQAGREEVAEEFIQRCQEVPADRWDEQTFRELLHSNPVRAMNQVRSYVQEQQYAGEGERVEVLSDLLDKHHNTARELKAAMAVQVRGRLAVVTQGSILDYSKAWGEVAETVTQMWRDERALYEEKLKGKLEVEERPREGAKKSKKKETKSHMPRLTALQDRRAEISEAFNFIRRGLGVDAGGLQAQIGALSGPEAEKYLAFIGRNQNLNIYEEPEEGVAREPTPMFVSGFLKGVRDRKDEKYYGDCKKYLGEIVGKIHSEEGKNVRDSLDSLEAPELYFQVYENLKRVEHDLRELEKLAELNDRDKANTESIEEFNAKFQDYLEQVGDLREDIEDDIAKRLKHGLFHELQRAKKGAQDMPGNESLSEEQTEEEVHKKQWEALQKQIQFFRDIGRPVDLQGSGVRGEEVDQLPGWKKLSDRLKKDLPRGVKVIFPDGEELQREPSRPGSPRMRSSVGEAEDARDPEQQLLDAMAAAVVLTGDDAVDKDKFINFANKVGVVIAVDEQDNRADLYGQFKEVVENLAKGGGKYQDKGRKAVAKALIEGARAAKAEADSAEAGSADSMAWLGDYLERARVEGFELASLESEIVTDKTLAEVMADAVAAGIDKDDFFNFTKESGVNISHGRAGDVNNLYQDFMRVVGGRSDLEGGDRAQVARDLASRLDTSSLRVSAAAGPELPFQREQAFLHDERRELEAESRKHGQLYQIIRADDWAHKYGFKNGNQAVKAFQGLSPEVYEPVSDLEREPSRQAEALGLAHEIVVFAQGRYKELGPGDKAKQGEGSLKDVFSGRGGRADDRKAVMAMARDMLFTGELPAGVDQDKLEGAVIELASAWGMSDDISSALSHSESDTSFGSDGEPPLDAGSPPASPREEVGAEFKKLVNNVVGALAMPDVAVSSSASDAAMSPAEMVEAIQRIGDGKKQDFVESYQAAAIDKVAPITGKGDMPSAQEVIDVLVDRLQEQVRESERERGDAFRSAIGKVVGVGEANSDALLELFPDSSEHVTSGSENVRRLATLASAVRAVIRLGKAGDVTAESEESRGLDEAATAVAAAGLPAATIETVTRLAVAAEERESLEGVTQDTLQRLELPPGMRGNVDRLKALFERGESAELELDPAHRANPDALRRKPLGRAASLSDLTSDKAEDRARPALKRVQSEGALRPGEKPDPAAAPAAGGGGGLDAPGDEPLSAELQGLVGKVVAVFAPPVAGGDAPDLKRISRDVRDIPDAQKGKFIAALRGVARDAPDLSGLIDASKAVDIAIADLLAALKQKQDEIDRGGAPGRGGEGGAAPAAGGGGAPAPVVRLDDDPVPELVVPVRGGGDARPVAAADANRAVEEPAGDVNLDQQRGKKRRRPGEDELQQEEPEKKVKDFSLASILGGGALLLLVGAFLGPIGLIVAAVAMVGVAAIIESKTDVSFGLGIAEDRVERENVQIRRKNAAIREENQQVRGERVAKRRRVDPEQERLTVEQAAEQAVERIKEGISRDLDGNDKVVNVADAVKPIGVGVHSSLVSEEEWGQISAIYRQQEAKYEVVKPEDGNHFYVVLVKEEEFSPDEHQAEVARVKADILGKVTDIRANKMKEDVARDMRAMREGGERRGRQPRGEGEQDMQRGGGQPGDGRRR